MLHVWTFTCTGKAEFKGSLAVATERGIVNQQRSCVFHTSSNGNFDGPSIQFHGIWVISCAKEGYIHLKYLPCSSYYYVIEPSTALSPHASTLSLVTLWLVLFLYWEWCTCVSQNWPYCNKIWLDFGKYILYYYETNMWAYIYIMVSKLWAYNLNQDKILVL